MYSALVQCTHMKKKTRFRLHSHCNFGRSVNGINIPCNTNQRALQIDDAGRMCEHIFWISNAHSIRFHWKRFETIILMSIPIWTNSEEIEFLNYQDSNKSPEWRVLFDLKLPDSVNAGAFIWFVVKIGYIDKNALSKGLWYITCKPFHTKKVFDLHFIW